jgi:hypothetical protein
MLYTTEIYLAALLYKILDSFLQREITSAHGGCFFPYSNCSSKKLRRTHQEQDQDAKVAEAKRHGESHQPLVFKAKTKMSELKEPLFEVLSIELSNKQKFVTMDGEACLRNSLSMSFNVRQ